MPASRTRLRKQVNEQIATLSKIVAQPEVKEILNEILEAPADQRLDVARRVATTRALAAKGVKIPKGFKITTRYFEEPPSEAAVVGGVVIEGRNTATRQAGTLCISLGAGVVVYGCLSYGEEISLLA